MAKQVVRIETVADLVKALCLGYNLEASILYRWTDQLLFILYSSLQGVPIAVESQGNDQLEANSQAYYAIDGVQGLVPQQ